MNKPTTVKALEELGRVRLSTHFFMRDFLYSEISQIEGIPNIPDFPDRAIEAGKQLCEQLLEPLQDRFGRIVIRSAYRAPAVNAKGAENNNQYSCAANEKNYAAHIWDHPDADGYLGATACIVVPALLPWYDRTDDWTPLACGFTTTCPMPASSGSPSWRHSICAGVQTRARSRTSAPTSAIRTRATRRRWSRMEWLRWVPKSASASLNPGWPASPEPVPKLDTCSDLGPVLRAFAPLIASNLLENLTCMNTHYWCVQ